MSKPEKFAGVEPAKERTWYLEVLLLFFILLGFGGLAGAVLGNLVGFVLLIIGAIGGALLFRALLNGGAPI
jgi:hypothetical protein